MTLKILTTLPCLYCAVNVPSNKRYMSTGFMMPILNGPRAARMGVNHPCTYIWLRDPRVSAQLLSRRNQQYDKLVWLSIDVCFLTMNVTIK